MLDSGFCIDPVDGGRGSSTDQRGGRGMVMYATSHDSDPRIRPTSPSSAEDLNPGESAQGGVTTSLDDDAAAATASSKRQRCSESSRELEWGSELSPGWGEHIHDEGESLEKVLQRMQSPSGYFGPGGPGGTNAED